jgi:hypothetical protein
MCENTDGQGLASLRHLVDLHQSEVQDLTFRVKNKRHYQGPRLLPIWRADLPSAFVRISGAASVGGLFHKAGDDRLNRSWRLRHDTVLIVLSQKVAGSDAENQLIEKIQV